MKTIRILLFIITPFFMINVYWQNVRINIDGSSPDASAILDVSITTKGMPIPRMSTTQRESISSTTTGLMVYDTSKSILYFYTGSAWQRMDSVVVGDDSADLPTSHIMNQLYLDTSGSEDKLYI